MTAPALLARLVSGSTRSSFGTLSASIRAYNGLSAFQRAYIANQILRVGSVPRATRAYATDTAATPKPRAKRTATAGKATKSKAAGAKKAVGAKAGKPKTKVKAKAKPKKKVVVKKKKKVAKKPVVKKQTVEQKAAAKERKAAAASAKLVKELRVAALEVPKSKPTSVMALYVQQFKGTQGLKIKECAEKFRQLPEAQVESLRAEALENKDANARAYDEWLSQHTPRQIRDANHARLLLRNELKKRVAAGKKTPNLLRAAPIKDARLVRKPLSSYIIYATERTKENDRGGRELTDFTKAYAADYRALGQAERQKYEDLAEADKDRFKREYKDTYGEEYVPSHTTAQRAARASSSASP